MKPIVLILCTGNSCRSHMGERSPDEIRETFRRARDEMTAFLSAQAGIWWQSMVPVAT